MNWTATLNDAVFTVLAWPSLAAFAAFGLALALLVVTVVLGRGLGNPRVALWILLGTGAAMALTASAPFALWSAQGGSAGDTLGSALFGVALRRELGAAVGAIGLVGGAAAIWAAARPESGWPGMRAGFALLSVAGAALGVVHASWVLLLGPFPVPTAELPARVQA